MAKQFVHLHNHTEYSLLDGAAKVDDMANQAYEFGMPSVAITDHGYMYGAINFYRACLDAGKTDTSTPGSPEYGIKPIIGCEIYFTPDSELKRDRKPELYHMILLAKNNKGYKNLMHLCSKSAVEGFYYKPRTTIEMLEDYHDGIVATSACMSGVIPKKIDLGQPDEARDWAKKFAHIFGPDDFYIELQDHGITTNTGTTQSELNVELDKIAREIGVKTISTNDMHYLYQRDAQVQDALICIGTGSLIADPNRMKFENDQFYMKSPDEMYDIFESKYAESLTNTVELADKCNVNINFGEIILPHIDLPEKETNESMLKKEALKGLEERYGDLSKRPDVLERFEHEYNIICSKGFAAYFLIVQDFTRWAKEHGVSVGPGRGSAAGSIISYALDITTFDPLENGLIFERFLSPERTEMPDIDMDFDDERRDEVIDYVRKKYGKEKVAHVITYSTIKAKQAIKDACRILDYPVYMGEKLSKMISNSPGVTLTDSLKKSEKKAEFYSPDLADAYKNDGDSKEIIDVALSIEGLTRGEGVHASAVIICRDPIYDHVPTKYDTKGGVEITQYDHVTCAELGLLKMDFLGLRTLTVMSNCKRNIKENYGIEINEQEIPFDDPDIFKLFWEGRTEGVFQVESAGMTALLKKMRPTEYKHIVAVLALYRPGPLNAGMVDDYVDGMTGRKEIQYYDERLKPILEETFGTVVYQEQVMQISVQMSGFTLGESDRLRKAMAKKKIALMTEVKQEWADGSYETMEDHWMNGAERNGYSRQVARKVWDDVLAFAEYAFNKSHSAAYGIITLQTAWLKAKYPNEYMAAVLTSHQGKTDKIVHYISACRREGIEILPPDVNESELDFTAVEDGVRFGLAGIRGVGEGVVEAIIEERNKNGDFEDIFDFVDRIDNKVATRRVLIALIKSGAFDRTPYTRKHMIELVDKANPANIHDAAIQRKKDKSAGQVSMFDMFGDNPDSGFVDEKPKPKKEEWDRQIKLAFEKEVLGIYVTDHPLRPYQVALENARDYSVSVIANGLPDGKELPDGSRHWYAGMVSNLDRKTTSRGDSMAIFTLEDMEGDIEVVVFPKLFKKVADLLEAPTDEAGRPLGDTFVRVKGKLERSDRGDQLIALEIEELIINEETNTPRVLEIPIHCKKLSPDLMSQMERIFESHPGNDRVEFHIEQVSGSVLRAELPLKVDSKDVALVSQVRHLVQ